MSLKRLFFLCFFLILGGKLFLSPTLAVLTHTPETSGYYFNPTKIEYEQALYQDKKAANLEKTTSSLVNNLLNEINKQLVGVQPETAARYQVYQPGALQIATGLTGQMIAQPPISSTEYLADLGSTLGLIKPAYAQAGTTGWDVLRGVLNLWKIFRNLAYLVFALIFLILGFLIMFRAKINPQTVISIETALPNLVVTLILITFSYFIASLMIDLIWVSIYLAINIFASYGLVEGTSATNKLLSQSIISLGISELNPLGDNGVATKIAEVINQITIEAIFGEDSPLKHVTNILAYTIIAIAFIFSFFKVFFQLIFCYIGLVLGTVFAPFQLLGHAFPGSQAFNKWLKTMLANALAFPAVAVMFLLVAALTKSWGGTAEVGYQYGLGWTGGGIPLLGMGNTNALQGILVLGMAMAMPKAIDLVKNALKVEKGGMLPSLGAAAFTPLAAAASLPGGFIQKAIQIGQAKQYLGLAKGERGKKIEALEEPHPHVGG